MHSPPPLATSVGPSHFFGWALRSTRLSTSLRASSSTTMVTVRGWNWPSRTALIQAKMSVEPTIPRLRVTSSSLDVLGILRTVLNMSVPARYSE